MVRKKSCKFPLPFVKCIVKMALCFSFQADPSIMQEVFMLKLRFLWLALCIAAISVSSCSKSSGVEGIYVHHSGVQKYYTLTISQDSGELKVHLEGVPLIEMEKTPWTTQCRGRLSDLELPCQPLHLRFEKDLRTVTVRYSDKSRQIFISEGANFEEELTIYTEEK